MSTIEDTPPAAAGAPMPGYIPPVSIPSPAPAPAPAKAAPESADPTVRYVVDTVRAMADGVIPQTQEMGAAMLAQVQGYGVAQMIFSGVPFAGAIVCGFFAYRWVKVAYSGRSVEVDPIVFASICAAVVGLIAVLTGGSYLVDGLTAYFAPAVWILKALK